MRILLATILAGSLIPAYAVAQDNENYCNRLIDLTAGPMTEQSQDLTETRKTAVNSLLDAARALADSDRGSCLTIVNAAQIVLAAGRQERVDGRMQDVTNLSEFPLQSLYENSWRAQALLDRNAYNTDGEHVGEVHDILMTPDGQVAAIIVEGGGILDLGDSHIRVDWDNVLFTDDSDAVVVPLEPESMTNFSLFYEDPKEEAKIMADEVRMTSILSDRVRLVGGQGYGFVEDILISDGKAVATIVRPDVSYGVNYRPLATPYYSYGYGYSPGYDYYYIPYSADQLSRLESFDLERIGGPDSVQNEGDGVEPAGSDG